MPFPPELSTKYSVSLEFLCLFVSPSCVPSFFSAQHFTQIHQFIYVKLFHYSDWMACKFKDSRWNDHKLFMIALLKRIFAVVYFTKAGTKTNENVLFNTLAFTATISALTQLQSIVESLCNFRFMNSTIRKIWLYMSLNFLLQAQLTQDYAEWIF